MKRRFRLWLAVPAVLLVVGCSTPVEPRVPSDNEDPKDPPPDNNAMIIDLDQLPILA